MTKQKNAAIIALDIVNSSDLPPNVLQNFVLKTATLLDFPMIKQVEAYRGDGLQTYVPKAAQSLLALLLQYCHFKVQGLEVRQSLGIGAIIDLQDRLAKSMGPAFELSGRALEKMKQEHLLVFIQFEDLKKQNEWRTHSVVLSDLLENWSLAQAEALLPYLLGKTQTEMAAQLNISQAAIHQRLKSAKVQVLQAILNRFDQMF